jgi:hypothetical protein
MGKDHIVEQKVKRVLFFGMFWHAFNLKINATYLSGLFMSAL